MRMHAYDETTRTGLLPLCGMRDTRAPRVDVATFADWAHKRPTMSCATCLRKALVLSKVAVRLARVSHVVALDALPDAALRFSEPLGQWQCGVHFGQEGISPANGCNARATAYVWRMKGGHREPIDFVCGRCRLKHYPSAHRFEFRPERVEVVP